MQNNFLNMLINMFNSKGSNLNPSSFMNLLNNNVGYENPIMNALNIKGGNMLSTILPLLLNSNENLGNNTMKSLLSSNSNNIINMDGNNENESMSLNNKLYSLIENKNN